jgi:hypothetical protein
MNDPEPTTMPKSATIIDLETYRTHRRFADEEPVAETPPLAGLPFGYFSILWVPVCFWLPNMTPSR